MTQENELQYLRRRLAETVGLHNEIAKRAGIPQGTVSRINCGADPRLSTAVKLLACLRELETCGSRIPVYKLSKGTNRPAFEPAAADPKETHHDDAV